jgi:GxxExxY protein
MSNLIEKELSYKIVGVLFYVYNNLGGGYQEKYYQRAIAKQLKNEGIKFKEQIYVPLSFKEESIGKYFLDFLIEDKVVLEIKAANKFYTRDIK